jgi:hypothetical protein
VTAQENHEAKLEKLEKVLGLATERLGEVAPLITAMLSIPTGLAIPRSTFRPRSKGARPCSRCSTRWRATNLSLNDN